MSKKSGIVRSTMQVTIITFLIKILGLLKQSIIAAYCGATDETDAFFIATGILVQLCVVVFSAISISLLTIHTDIYVNEGREKSNELINGALRVFLPIALVISVIFFLGSSLAARAFAPTYNDDQLQTLSHYIRIMSCSFVIWCYYLIINVILETDKRFLPAKGQSFFQNLFLIIGAMLFYRNYGMTALVYGFLLSGLVQCILVTWCARKDFCVLFKKIDVRAQIKSLLALSIPLIVGSAIYEINDIVDKQISTGLGMGNVSYLTYGGTINEIVTGVVVSSVSVVLFSHFATWVAKGDIEQVEINIRRVIEYLTILILPIMIMCLGAGDQIVKILYGRGNFGDIDVQLTYGVVIGYAVGFIFQAARANIVRVYYAFQDTRTPMVNGALSVAINIVLSLVLSKYIGATGIALATSIAMLIVTILLFKGVKKYLPHFAIMHSIREIIKGVCASCASGAILIVLRRILNYNLYIDFIIEGIIVVAIYLLLLFVMKSECLKFALNRAENNLHK